MSQTLCGMYNKLIQCSSVIHCNTFSYIAPLPHTLYRSLNQFALLPAKHTVFRTILGRFSSECGAYDKLIQFYSLIQCNTCSYNVSFFKVCIVQPQNASFYPQIRRFRYNFRFKSCPLGIDPNFNRGLFLRYILCFGVHILFLTFQPSNESF